MRIEWIRIEDQLPPFYQRVLVWEQHTNLYDYNGRPVHIFLYSRYPAPTEGNNTVPYRWGCENSGTAFGQDVTYWAEVTGPWGKEYAD